MLTHLKQLCFQKCLEPNEVAHELDTQGAKQLCNIGELGILPNKCRGINLKVANKTLVILEVQQYAEPLPFCECRAHVNRSL